MAARGAVEPHRGAHAREKVCSQDQSLQKVRMFQLSSCPPHQSWSLSHHPPIITESFLNCQIELSGGHLFNKDCWVYSNEMGRMRESCLFITGASLRIKILSRIVEMNHFDTLMLESQLRNYPLEKKSCQL